MMGDVDFLNVFGPTFWIVMAVLTIALVIGGYWLGGVIGRRTDTGFGGFMVVMLVTLMIAGFIMPLAIFGALGNIMELMNPFASIDEQVFLDQGLDGFTRIAMAVFVAFGSTVAFFVASVIGLARGRN